MDREPPIRHPSPETEQVGGDGGGENMLTFRALRWMALALLCLVGCETPRGQIKPPVIPEKFNGPPDETRYNGPPQYPKGTLNQTPVRRNTVEEGAPPIQGSFNGRPGMPYPQQ